MQFLGLYQVWSFIHNTDIQNLNQPLNAARDFIIII